MTTVASTAAGARRPLTEHTVTVRLTPDDITMIRAFMAWNKDSPTCSPKKDQIERGYGAHKFRDYSRQERWDRRLHMSVLVPDMTGPHTFRRLVAIGVIEHSRNGHCWLTAEGARVAREL